MDKQELPMNKGEPHDFMSVVAEMYAEAIDNAVVADLRKSSEEYKVLNTRREEIVEKYPLIEQMMSGDLPMDGRDILTLTTEEYAGVVEYNKLTINLHYIEREHIYYAGHRDCVRYLRKIGAW